jgi:putative transposase
MPRSLRVDEAGGLYHAYNRGNLGTQLFWNDEDYAAFEQIIAEGLARADVEVYAFQLMPNHWHLILRSLHDGEMSQFLRWVTATHTMRYHARYDMMGEGHVYQGRFKSFPIQDDRHFLTVCRYVESNAMRGGYVSRAEDWRWGSLWRWQQKPEPEPTFLSPWPIPRSPSWLKRVNEGLAEDELQAVRESAKRGRPFGDAEWVESSVERLGMQSTVRPRGRPPVR